MKRLLAVILILISIQTFSQTDFQVTVIDSFLSTGQGQGISGLNSVTYNNTIHLAFFYKDISSVTYLLYAVKNGDSFLVDTVASPYPDYNSYGSSTALQFDGSGNPIIYAGWAVQTGYRGVGVYRRTTKGWEYTLIDGGLGNSQKVRAVVDGSIEIGCAYPGKGIGYDKNTIIYSWWDIDHWEKTFITAEQNTFKTDISITSIGDKIFLAFGEGRYPDSLITRVFVKDGGIWSESFTDLMEVPYAGGGINGLHAFVGVSPDGNVFLLNDLTNESLPRYFKYSGKGWERQPVNTPGGSLLTGQFKGRNIVLDAANTMFILSGRNWISLVKENGDAWYNGIPFNHNIYLCDMVILNDALYIYIFDGFTEWPYNQPVTFKEVKIEINNLITDIEDGNNKQPEKFELFQNFPNPFNPTTTIKYSIPVGVEAPSNTSLRVYDILGNEIATLVNEKKESGYYEVEFDASDLSSGVYIYQLRAGSFASSKKFVLIK